MKHDPIPPQNDKTLFFTVRLADRHSDLLLREIARLRSATRTTLKRYPFEIVEAVVMPSALHTIWRLPAHDVDFSARWRLLKSQFSRGLPTPDNRNPVTQRQGDKGIWQRRFWEHHLRDTDDLDAHRQMILNAPVQAGLVKRPQDWPYSSIHRALRQGIHVSRAASSSHEAPTPFRYGEHRTTENA